MVRNDLLVAPILTEQDSAKGWRMVYLPGPDSWFRFNLSLDESTDNCHPLSAKERGGSCIKVEARIQQDMSSITPMFLREGKVEASY